MASGVDVAAGEYDFGPMPGTEEARVRRDPGNVEQRHSAVDVGDPGDGLAGLVEGLAVPFALVDGLCEPSGEGDTV